MPALLICLHTCSTEVQITREKIIQWGEEASLQQLVLGQLNFHAKFQHLPHIIWKNELKMDNDINVTAKTVKL